MMFPDIQFINHRVREKRDEGRERRERVRRSIGETEKRQVKSCGLTSRFFDSQYRKNYSE